MTADEQTGRIPRLAALRPLPHLRVELRPRPRPGDHPGTAGARSLGLLRPAARLAARDRGRPPLERPLDTLLRLPRLRRADLQDRPQCGPSLLSAAEPPARARRILRRL